MFRSRSVRGFLYVLMSGFMLGGVARPAHADLPPDTVDLVIVTSAELAPAFTPLATAREAEGLAARVVILDEIAAWVTPGPDTPATIRIFLQQAIAQWGIRYVLLGGDTEVLPPRYVHSTFYPFGGSTDIPADLYFAGLSGDWDADGDGIYGEVGDDCDLTCDVAVGRAPVRTIAEADAFVAKSLIAAPGETSRQALILATSGWEPAGESIAPLLLDADPPWSVARLYADPTGYPAAEPLNRVNAIAALNDGGLRIVHDAGHTSSDGLDCGDADLDATDALALRNPLPFVLVSWFGLSGGAFDDDTVLEDLLRNPDGGAAAVISTSRASFPATTQTDYVLPFYGEVLGPGVRLGDAMRAVLDAVDPAALGLDTIERWTHLVTVLLGDPTLRVIGPATVDVPSAASAGLRVTASPNPFNPRVQISVALGEAAPTRSAAIDVYDLAGRHVAAVMRGDLGPGAHTATWDGRDDAGAEVSAGVYVARVQAGTARRVVKLVLAR